MRYVVHDHSATGLFRELFFKDGWLALTTYCEGVLYVHKHSPSVKNATNPAAIVITPSMM